MDVHHTFKLLCTHFPNKVSIVSFPVPIIGLKIMKLLKGYVFIHTCITLLKLHTQSLD